MRKLWEAAQQAPGHAVQLACADQGYTGGAAFKTAQGKGIDLQTVKLSKAKKGFALSPRRRMVEKSFGWMTRLRRPSRDHE